MQPPLNDIAAYPRVYRLRRGAVVGRWVMGSLLLVFAAPISSAIVSGALAESGFFKFFLLACSCFPLIFGLGPIIDALTYRLTLLPDSVQLRRIIWRDEIHYSDIAGISRKSDEDGESITLLPNKEGVHSLTLGQDANTDEFFERWLASMPDLTNNRKGALHLF
jgi:hypothetical protein